MGKSEKPGQTHKDFHGALIETLELTADDDLMKEIRKGIREIQAGEGIPWEKAIKEHDAMHGHSRREFPFLQG